jgi:hypothetical protein
VCGISVKVLGVGGKACGLRVRLLDTGSKAWGVRDEQRLDAITILQQGMSGLSRLKWL